MNESPRRCCRFADSKLSSSRYPALCDDRVEVAEKAPIQTDLLEQTGSRSRDRDGRVGVLCRWGIRGTKAPGNWSGHAAAAPACVGVSAVLRRDEVAHKRLIDTEGALR